MLRCTLGTNARANTDVEAANAGGEVDEDGYSGAWLLINVKK